MADDGGTTRGHEATLEFELGRDLLEQGNVNVALCHLARAFESCMSDAEAMSWYGLALSKGGVDRLRGVVLCEAALRQSGQRPPADLFHNLGRAYLAAGYRTQAVVVLRRGAVASPEHAGIRAVLDEMGFRRRPVIPFLSRRNPLNKYLGLLLSRLSSNAPKDA